MLPDETTILNFRHLLEEHELGQGLFEEISRHLESQGLCGFGRERSWTRASLRRHRQRRIVQVSETLRCVRRRRGMNYVALRDEGTHRCGR